MSARRYVDKPALSADWTPLDAEAWIQRRHEAPELGAAIARQLRSLCRHTAEGDIEALEQLLLIVDRVGPQYAREAVLAMHTRYSWTEIAKLTGTTRQAARQRFGLPTLLAGEIDDR